MTSRRTGGLLVCSLVASTQAGCGAKTELFAPPIPQRDASDVVLRDVPVMDVPADIPEQDVPLDVGPRACVWRAGNEVEVDQGPSSARFRIDSWVTTGNTLVLGWTRYGMGMPRVSRVLARYDAMANLVQGPVEIAENGTNLANLSLMGMRARDNTLAVLFWSIRDTCQFGRFDATSLAPIGPIVPVLNSSCGNLQLSSTGFSFMHEEPESLRGYSAVAPMRLDGTLFTPPSVVLIPAQDDPTNTARLAVGTDRFVLAWQRNVPNDSNTVLRVFDDRGQPQSSVQIVSNQLASVQFAPVFENGALFWRNTTAGSDLQMQLLGPDGLPQSQTSVVSDVPAGGFAASSFRNKVLFTVNLREANRALIRFHEGQRDGSRGSDFVEVASAPLSTNYLQANVTETPLGVMALYAQQVGTIIRLVIRPLYCE